MKQITSNSAAHVGSYGVCIGNGNNVLADTINGFLMSMNRAVDDFAELCSRLETEEDKSAMALQQGKLETFMSEAEDASRSSVNTVAELNAMRARVSGHVSSGLAILAWA